MSEIDKNVTIVLEGAYDSGNGILYSKNFVHCVCLILKGTKASMMIHNQPLRTKFPTKQEVYNQIGDITGGICIVSKHQQSLGTIHFLADIQTPMPNDKYPSSKDIIPYMHIYYDSFDVCYNHRNESLMIMGK